MNSISDSDLPWNNNVQVAVATQGAPDRTSGGKDSAEESEDGFKMFGEDGFTFLDFLDIINPLQHIPVIGSLYREWTGDTLDPGSRVLGGTLFFGPVGTVASIANVLVDDTTGKDLGEHFLAFFEDAPQQLADSDSPAPPEQAYNNPISPVQTAMLSPSAPLDPVTAWAMSETAYRKSVTGKSAPRPDDNIPGNRPGNWDAVPARQRAAYKPAGAIATEGGWFTDTMLSALGRYKDSALLGARKQPAVVDLSR